MHTTLQILEFLQHHQFGPVLAGGSPRSKKRVRFARMCIRRLPPVSAIRYCIHAADASVPNRLVSDQILQAEGFRTMRELLPEMAIAFGDLWPGDELEVPTR